MRPKPRPQNLASRPCWPRTWNPWLDVYKLIFVISSVRKTFYTISGINKLHVLYSFVCYFLIYNLLILLGQWTKVSFPPFDEIQWRKCKIHYLHFWMYIFLIVSVNGMCSGKLKSPKWKNFKGIEVGRKDKIRLNNLIWREWHMQCNCLPVSFCWFKFCWRKIKIVFGAVLLSRPNLSRPRPRPGLFQQS